MELRLFLGLSDRAEGEQGSGSEFFCTAFLWALKWKVFIFQCKLKQYIIFIFFKAVVVCFYLSKYFYRVWKDFF